ncbi:hypothetical protein EV193_101789 [Herbihabitans rhizosphaerae]|uniref:HicA-like toxin of HicAB toxin-antitoxin system n=1 Tax=Herbihabitans rhizosphaerae TaxID=1872711 RepID=A0A4Q7L5K0_9PSEU|nr:hypothetical protein [Herbihabitans rhizosphaerae]RZS44908.1 hypothetical protein EV193_101789 [Herbihabitans rhizosphaerae]
MKRRQVIKKIAAAAKDREVEWILAREGARHTVYTLNGVLVPIPRHSELGETFAVEIFKECEGVLGKGWWKK